MTEQTEPEYIPSPNELTIMRKKAEYYDRVVRGLRNQIAAQKAQIESLNDLLNGIDNQHSEPDDR